MWFDINGILILSYVWVLVCEFFVVFVCENEVFKGGLRYED